MASVRSACRALSKTSAALAQPRYEFGDGVHEGLRSLLRVFLSGREL